MSPKRTHRRYTAEFKAEVALAALTERQLLAELAAHYQLSTTQLTRWKLQLRKQVVGWQVGATMPEELVTTALQRACWSQLPTPELIVHSNRGGQYCGNAYRQLLHDHQAVRSQSRRGDCYDNVQAESLWSRLKTEVLELRERPVFADLADAQASVADYFDYYNHGLLIAERG